MAAVPQELIEDILPRLPVKSLLRFKTASKNWYSFISKDHTFHFKQSLSSSASKNLLLYDPAHCNARYAIFRSLDIDSHASANIKFLAERATPCRIIGSANGLICVSPFSHKRCFLWNPCTDEHKTISVLPPGRTNNLFGFGYDSFSDDYKIVGGCGSQFQFFSLKTKSWKKLEYSVTSPMFGRYLWPTSAFYSNGALHWCVGPKITAFHLSKDQFFYLDLPEEIELALHDNVLISSSVPLFDYQGSLCLSWRKSIWVMKEYGNPKSWTKLSTSLPHEYAKPVGISRYGEVVLSTRAGLEFLKSEEMSDDDLIKMSKQDAFLFKESLISPKCFDSKR